MILCCCICFGVLGFPPLESIFCDGCAGFNEVFARGDRRAADYVLLESPVVMWVR